MSIPGASPLYPAVNVGTPGSRVGPAMHSQGLQSTGDSPGHTEPLRPVFIAAGKTCGPFIFHMEQKTKQGFVGTALKKGIFSLGE